MSFNKERIQEIEEKTKAILTENGLFSIPVDPVRLAQLRNIKVHNAVFSETTLSAMVAKRGNNISILVNTNDAPFRKRFSIAHELGHVYLHLEHDGEFADHDYDLYRDLYVYNDTASQNNIKEIEANQFAASLLMPKDLIIKEFKVNSIVVKIAQKFQVSVDAMKIRLLKLNLI